MTERGGGPPSATKPGGAPSAMTNNSSPSKRFLADHPYHEQSSNDKK